MVYYWLWRFLYPEQSLVHLRVQAVNGDCNSSFSVAKYRFSNVPDLYWLYGTIFRQRREPRDPDLLAHVLHRYTRWLIASFLIYSWTANTRSQIPKFVWDHDGRHNTRSLRYISFTHWLLNLPYCPILRKFAKRAGLTDYYVCCFFLRCCSFLGGRISRVLISVGHKVKKET